MGFYLRKSVRVGPFRFNLSNSGIGVSTGIKGLRVGTGPRGNYVQMGYGGIYFRQTLSNNRVRPAEPTSYVQGEPSVTLKKIQSGDVTQMVDSSSATLLEEINAKAKKLLIWPWALALAVCIPVVLVFAEAPVWCFVLLVPICIAALVLAVQADKLRKTIVLFYELEPHIEQSYQRLHDMFGRLQTCSKIWHIDSSGKLRNAYDRKVHAGANTVVSRRQATIETGAPRYFKSNILIPFIPAGRVRLYFLPDRILVWAATGVGAINFDELEIIVDETRFVEDDGVPSDARIVGQTWKYVNKSGGPDRRFKDNREIPVVLYEEILLTSRSGLRELFQFSKTGVGAQLKTTIKDMATAISQPAEPNAQEVYIKCPCNNCDIIIEFPADGVGQKIKCPHCGLETVLFKPTDAIV